MCYVRVLRRDAKRCTCSLTHYFTHSLHHSLTHSLTHSSGASRVDYRETIEKGDPDILTPDVAHNENMIPAHVTEQAATGAKKCGRCSLHGCLDARRIEIVPGTGGRCDACLKIVCIKCDGCKCYKCEYATRRCEVCLALSLEKPALYLLMEPAAAFPNTNNRLLECNICKVLHSQRTRIASEVRKKKRRESCGYKLNDFGPRMTHRVKLHLRKWRATVVTRGWQPGDRRISRSLTSV